MTSYSRQDVLRILQISSRQLLGWEKAGLILPQQAYTFQDLGQLRTVRALREDDVSAASIRHSIVAMRAVAGMTNPLIEATVVRTGARLAFRCSGAMVDPIRRQLLFDFERLEQLCVDPGPAPLRRPAIGGEAIAVQTLFLAAVQAEESGEKNRAIELYEQLVARNPNYAPAFINLGTIYFHLRRYGRAEELYRRATETDPEYVLAFFDLGNVLDELNRPGDSIRAYLRAVELAPRYADAHYNLALAYERSGENRSALRHWQAYIRLDRSGPWAEHARGQIRKLLDGEKLAVVWRARAFVPPSLCPPALELAAPLA
ncbi:MAG: tetratricopeptide repeat protein [Terracidiphilus sp.]